MLNAFIDHLWQSLGFAALICVLVWVARRGRATLRLWLWRVAALKFLVPFALFHALGGWLGFPVRHSAVPPPALVTELVARGTRLASPAQTFQPPHAWILLSVALAMSAVCVAGILRQARRARRQRERDPALAATDWSYGPAPLGFWHSFILAFTALCTASLPLIAGATRNRLWRQQVLAIDQQMLQSARIPMTRYLYDRFGVSIRVNGDCQEPCGHHESFVVERVKWTVLEKRRAD